MPNSLRFSYLHLREYYIVIRKNGKLVKYARGLNTFTKIIKKLKYIFVLVVVFVIFVDSAIRIPK